MREEPACDAPAESGHFLHKAVRVASGHAAGYVIAFAASPVLARLYGPESFGVLAVFVLAVSSLAVVATLRFDQAIPVPSSNRAAGMVTQLAAVGMAVFAVVLLVALSLVPRQAGRWFGGYLSGDCGVLVVAGTLCLATYQTVAGWLLRSALYRDLAAMRVVFALTMTGVQLLVPLCGGSLLLGLPAGQAAGFAAGAIYGALRVRGSSPALQPLSLRTVRRVAWRHRKFALFGVPATLVSNLGIHVPALILALCYDLEVAGMFALAQRVFTTPLTLLTNSFSRVFYAEVTRHRSPDGLARLFRQTAASAAWLSAAPILTVAVLAPWCFGAVFGTQWTAAGWICTLLAPMVWAMSVAQVVSPVFDVVGRQDRRLYRESFCTAAIAGGLLAAWFSGWSAFGAIGVASLGGAVGYTSLVLLAARYSQPGEKAELLQDNPRLAA